MPPGQPPNPYQPQPNPYPPQQPQPGQPQVVIVQQPVMMQRPVFNRHPVNIICQLCSSQATTQTRTEMGTGSWVICAALCFFTGCCCCFPCCCGGCQDVVHTCPKCKRPVGRKAIM